MNYNEGRDEILRVFNEAWGGLGYPVVWTDVPGDVPKTKTVWARPVIRHADGYQSSLADYNGKRQFENIGVVIIQVFAPVGAGSTQGYNAAQVVADAYRQVRDSCVWFRNARIKEAGNSGAFEQINVLVDFSYDSVR